MGSKLEKIILTDLEYSTNHNIDQMLWKSVYHQLIESLRRELSHSGDKTATRQTINSLLDEVSSSTVIQAT